MLRWTKDRNIALRTPIVAKEDLEKIPFPLEVIEEDAQLLAVMDAWKKDGVGEVAVDLEFEATLHYPNVKQLCTVQVYDGVKYYLVDGIKLTQPGLTGLKTFFETKNFLKLWFAQSSDRFIIKNHGYKLDNVYDIQMASGSRLKGRSLTAFVKVLLGEKLCGEESAAKTPKVKVPRSKKAMQLSNWVLRPLSAEQVVYALNDVKYLFRLKEAILSAPNVTNPKLAVAAKAEYGSLKPADKSLACMMYDSARAYSEMHHKPIADFMSPSSFVALARDFGHDFPDKRLTCADVVPCLFGISGENAASLATIISEKFNKAKFKH